MPEVDIEEIPLGTPVLVPTVLGAIPPSLVKGVFAGGSKGVASVSMFDSLDRPHGVYTFSAKTLNVTDNTKLTDMWIKSFRDGGQYGLAYAGSSGCDPEIFAFDKDTLIPATAYLSAKSKANSIRFYDGVQAEFCPMPGGCLESLGSMIRSEIRKLRISLEGVAPSAKFSIRNSVRLTPEQMQNFPKEALVFRCSDSLNIYSDFGMQVDALEYPWRFAGGHIHVGMAHPNPTSLKGMIEAMDCFLAVAGVSMAANLDNPERRRSYGRCGEFRLPKHGVEYRVLSNFWLCSPLIYHLTFELARMAYRMGQSGMFPHVWEGNIEEVRDCVNNHDVKTARKIITRNEWLYRHVIEGRFKSYARPTVNVAYETVLNGVERVVKDPDDIYGNWQLDNAEWREFGRIPRGQWRYTSF